MNWIDSLQQAINYIEDNITEKLDIEEIAARSFSSSYHFQRIFSILCGYTLGEYIRNRRLSLAGAELQRGEIKVIDAAVKYGYESPDSFAKAFQKFHGVTPSQAKFNSVKLKNFSRLSIKISLEGGNILNYKIVKKPEIIITGLKRRFNGSPADRYEQQHGFMVNGNTRFIRFALQGMAKDCDTEYCVISDIDDKGYSFTIGSAIPDFYNKHLRETVGEYSNLLDIIKIPENTYVSVETERSVFCMDEHLDLRKRLVNEWLANSDYIIADAPEITIIHLYNNHKDNSYVELLIPIEKKTDK